VWRWEGEIGQKMSMTMKVEYFICIVRKMMAEVAV
jgi:hypothetical protein